MTDLFDEVDEEHAKREAAMTRRRATRRAARRRRLPAVTTAVVAVCSGDGLVELFAQLGVQGVVTGGQTMNPSTAELLDAVERVNADQVVILPNNKNIIPVAEQLDALTTKTVVVVPTASMPEALAALVVYDPEADGRRQRDGDDRSGRLRRDRRGHAGGARHDQRRPARSPLATGSASSAATASSPSAATLVRRGERRCSTRSSATTREIVTVITGDGGRPATPRPIEALARASTRHGVQVEVHHGGQPLYPYLFGVE